MELREQLEQTLGDSYAVERELGGGGMSRVFLATDRTLDRPVVVKVLSGEHSEGVSADRFRREIQVIAKLQHPHIVPILSAGSSEAGLHYVMPYLRGETLRARLSRESPLPVAECVRILRDVLDALAFAHGHGVIHRDIKPENILLEAGHAVVADFGVAKALQDSGAGTLTGTGIALGTPAYMAPEQAAADPHADHRADLYAVAVAGYEMLCGSPPFTGSPTQVMAGHLSGTPVQLRERRSDVPPVLSAVIMRALEKDPAQRPQSATEMLSAIEAAVTPRDGGPNPVRSTPVSRRSWARVVAATAVVIPAVGYVAWHFTRPAVAANAQAIAIMPLSVPTGDTALVRLGQNLVTMVSANLDGVGEIRVSDAMAVLNHARTRGNLLSMEDALAIARRVGARSVLTGTLAPIGNGVRADVSLYDVSSPNAPMTRVSVLAPVGDPGALTDSLTWSLLRSIWTRGTPPTTNVSSITTHSPVALREFLEGERYFSRGGMLEAAAAYKRAIVADTTFWFAHYRHRLALAWISEPTDTTINRRLHEHIADLPERERLLVSVDSARTESDRLRRYRAIVARYPDYAPAWMALADRLIHHAVRAGYDVAEAIDPWQQVVRLMPGDMESANHLTFACTAAADFKCARTAWAHFDSLVRADSAPLPATRFNHRTLLAALDGDRPGLIDSILGAAHRDSVPADAYSPALMPLLAERPALARDWERTSTSPRPGPPGVGSQTMARLVQANRIFFRTMRGDWSQVDSLQSAWDTAAPLLPPAFPKLAALEMRVLGELQGFVQPSAATGDGVLRMGLRTSAERASGAWIVAANALLRGDSARWREQTSALARDTTIHARIATRSLRAIALGRAGDHATAAESLLVLEREHGERDAKVWVAFSADRLLGARWLADQRRYAAADSLLRFTRGFIFAESAVSAYRIFASTQLTRSEIAEALGQRDEAIRSASIFLAIFDLASPQQKGMVEEARQRIARLGGKLDSPRPGVIR